MCCLSTKQEYHSLKENSTLQDYSPSRCSTLPTDSCGPDHGTPPQKQKRHHPHYCRSWLFTSCGLPAMLNKHHGTRHCPALPETRVLMVQLTQENDQ